jgi:hypothetical protein
MNAALLKGNYEPSGGLGREYRRLSPSQHVSAAVNLSPHADHFNENAARMRNNKKHFVAYMKVYFTTTAIHQICEPVDIARY